MGEVTWRRENNLFRAVFIAREEEALFKNFRDPGSQQVEEAVNNTILARREVGDLSGGRIAVRVLAIFV